MIFSNCKNLEISGLKHINSPKFHISITDCHYANISSLQIIAPPLSPNTDGIDIASSSNIFIHNSTIKTGDDCIAIKGGTSNTTISEIVCGPGHGIRFVIFSHTHTHTHTYGGSGFARNITFSNINFTAVENPIVIDQFYCPHKICNNKVSTI
ncbi:PREDICTED: probable polygalacturonase At3g15720 [Erythranthe guttata]|uniref:probable polygalacturonase At3g15720 n=1 Tax=Erythranthe guttata TaxID=4155 RepID=UPI00064D9044|nr:PREDICTED: probable polygalacturonase At3g15720 [Erythranthe guttata]|eukprot:XP_012856146.1 PREDICTED: probable polygalacturonase At3g15720 [Erythranthe guttata]